MPNLGTKDVQRIIDEMVPWVPY